MSQQSKYDTDSCSTVNYRQLRKTGTDIGASWTPTAGTLIMLKASLDELFLKLRCAGERACVCVWQCYSFL